MFVNGGRSPCSTGAVVMDAARLEQRRGALISRDRATLKAFAFARMVRDTRLTWPARVGPQLAATFELDATAVTLYLEDQVRQLVAELPSERVEF